MTPYLHRLSYDKNSLSMISQITLNNVKFLQLASIDLMCSRKDNHHLDREESIVDSGRVYIISFLFE